MLNINNGTLTLSLASIERWHIVIAVNFVYGFVTHYHSLPAMKRAIHKQGYAHGLRKFCSFDIFIVFLYRIILGLPIRLLVLPLGIIISFLCLISSGQLCSNFAFSWFVQWHAEPDDIITI